MEKAAVKTEVVAKRYEYEVHQVHSGIPASELERMIRERSQSGWRLIAPLAEKFIYEREIQGLGK